MPAPLAETAPKPGGGVLKTAGMAVAEGGAQPGTLGAPTPGGRHAEMPLRTLTTWVICCCCRVSCCCISLIILSKVAGGIAACVAGLGMGVTVAGVVVGAGGAPSGAPPGGGPMGRMPEGGRPAGGRPAGGGPVGGTAEAASAITEATIRSADDRVGVSPMARSICVR